MAYSFELNTANGNNTAIVSHSFRTSKDSNGKSVKRDSLEFSFTPVTDYDSKVNMILNESLAQYGKLLIAQNAENWEYIPDSSEINIDNLYTYQSAPSARGNRLINKITLGEIAEAYIRWATSNGKSQKQADTGARVISNQFKDILGNQNAMSAMTVNMNSFADYLTGLDINDENTLSDESTAALIRLIENLTELSNPSITADSL